MRRKRTNSLDFQAFEERRCLTVAAGVTDFGSLFVRGDADGTVDIVAISQDTFKVSDNGVEVGTYEGVERNILVKIDQHSDVPADDTVHIRLGESDLHNVRVNLGNGNNRFAIGGQEAIDRVIFEGGRGDDMFLLDVDTEFIATGLMGPGSDTMAVSSHANRVRFRGGDGDDALNIRRDALVRHVGAGLGDGDNTFHLAGHVGNRVHVVGGDGADTISIAPEARVGGSMGLNLGNGDNVVNIRGQIAGHLRVRAGSGNDHFNVGENARIGQTTGIALGDGDNGFRLAGSFGDRVFLRAESGNDRVHITETATVRSHVGVLLGEGDNVFSHDGEIFGNLVVLSKNHDDFFVSNGIVHGHTRLVPGGQA